MSWWLSERNRHKKQAASLELAGGSLCSGGREEGCRGLDWPQGRGEGQYQPQTLNRRPCACAGSGGLAGQETPESAVPVWGCLFPNSEITSLIVPFTVLLPFFISVIWGAKQNASFLQYLLLEASCWNAEISLGMISHSLRNGNSSLFLHQALNCFQC